MGETPKKDAGLVFPGLVGGLLEHGLDDEPESLVAVAARCLEMVRREYPAESDRLRGAYHAAPCAGLPSGLQLRRWFHLPAVPVTAAFSSPGSFMNEPGIGALPLLQRAELVQVPAPNLDLVIELATQRARAAGQYHDPSK